MYITCKNCNTNFVVAQEQIGTHGRKVRCSKCTNTWYQEPLEIKINKQVQYSNQEELNPLKPGINLPVPILYTQKSDNSFTFLLLSIIICLIYLLFEITS